MFTKFKVDQPKHAVDPARQPWVEKYRPRTIDDISSQEHAVAVLRKTLQSANLPHLLFYGPPGTGKTSTILALARQLYGPENFRHRVLELNASDERGISIIREKIKDFARQTPRAAIAGADGTTYPCPPYKIIILDEADSMTQDAQGALRRIMETYARITRFCLVCNYVTRIIEPVASRCSKFRFKPLDDEASFARLSYISNQEQVAVTEDVLRTVLKTSGGDLRRAITYLQSASRLASSGTPPTPITSWDIQEIAGVVPDELIFQLGCELGMDPPIGVTGIDFPSRARSFEHIRNTVRNLVQNGYPASQILTQLHDLTVSHPTLSSRQKSQCALIFAEADKALCDGADEELWILEVALRVHKALA